MTFQASSHICQLELVLGVVVPSRSGESTDFEFVSRIDNARRSPSLSGASRCSRSISRSSPTWDMLPSRLCHRFEPHNSAMFMAPSILTTISGYKLLYLHPFPIFIFPPFIIHDDSLRFVMYPSRLACRWRPDSFSARVHARLGAG